MWYLLDNHKSRKANTKLNIVIRFKLIKGNLE